MEDQQQFVIDIDAFCRQSRILNSIKFLIVPFVDGFLRVGRLNRDVRRLQKIGDSGTPVRDALDIIGLEPEYDGPGVNGLDPTRPQIIIANQPYGATEAPAMGWLVERSGCDVRILGTRYIEDVGPLSKFVISVDSFDRKGRKVENIAPMRASIRALRNNASLVLFPAGIVSEFQFSTLSVRDPEWTEHAVKLARMTGARIIPAFIHGRNSWLFYALGLIHPILRSMFIVREFYRQNDIGTMRITVGEPIEPEELATFPKDNAAATQVLRDRVHALKDIDRIPKPRERAMAS